ncbi:Hypothetical predicted protein [Paramuricea clavata]|uniref:Uncharacterized protein n=1 Tax=Paramuricea clavata TaxID=317549 RepID=A0A7D9EK97_PARCT|nr:Hypothetical predicted protein [Paramuricea clavata]
MASQHRGIFSSGRQPQQTRPQTSEDTKSEPKNFKECMPIYDNYGNLLHVLNTKTGKLEEPAQREKLAFDPATGKLGLVKVQAGIDPDYQIQLGMAEDGFFMFEVQVLPSFSAPVFYITEMSDTGSFRCKDFRDIMRRRTGVETETKVGQSSALTRYIYSSLLYITSSTKLNMSRRNTTTSTSDANVVQEGLHLTGKDGTLVKGFNPRNGKWGEPARQGMAFDPNTGKLVVTTENPDNFIAIPMAAEGFFMELTMSI